MLGKKEGESTRQSHALIYRIHERSCSDTRVRVHSNRVGRCKRSLPYLLTSAKDDLGSIASAASQSCLASSNRPSAAKAAACYQD